MRNIIRKGDVAKLRSAIETSSREGSINLERALEVAAKAGQIAPETVKETLAYLGK